jgi:hypothetical protein
MFLNVPDRHGLDRVIEIYQETIAHVKNNGLTATQGFCDSIGLPEGSLQKIMNPIRELFPEQTFANYIPLEPGQAPGANKLTYPRISYDNTSEFGQVGSNYRRSIDTNIEPVEYSVYRDKAQIVVDRYENDRINYALSNGNLSGAINLFAEKMRGAELNSAKIRDELLSVGRPDIGILGMLSHPDVITVYLGEAFPSTNADYNNSVLKTAIAEVERQTGGALNVTSLWLPHTDFTTLNNQGRSGTDLTTLQFFLKNQPDVLINGTATKFEVWKSARLENAYSDGVHAFTAFCRHVDCISQVVPMPMTPQQSVITTEGYIVPLDADYAGAQIKQGKSVVNFKYSRP